MMFVLVLFAFCLAARDPTIAVCHSEPGREIPPEVPQGVSGCWTPPSLDLPILT
jgi:hypothetical protein